MMTRRLQTILTPLLGLPPGRTYVLGRPDEPIEADAPSGIETVTVEDLDALPAADVVWIDGLPNWAAVHDALTRIDARRLRDSAPFPVVLVANAGWPYGRRDGYGAEGASGALPSRALGMRPDEPELCEQGGLFAEHQNAIYEGTVENGVRTALEDFVDARQGEIVLRILPGFHGVGILTPSGFADRHPEVNRRIDAIGSEGPANEWLAAIEAGRIDAELRTIEESGRLDDTLATLREEIEDWARRYEDANRSREKELRRLADLEQEVHELRQRNEEQDRQLENLVGAVEDERTSFGTERDEARARISELIAETARHHVREEERESETALLREELERSQARAEELTERVRTLGERREREAGGSDQELESLRGKLEQARKQVRQLEVQSGRPTAVAAPRYGAGSDLEAARERATSLERDLQDLLVLFEELRGASRRLLNTKRWKLGHQIGEVHRKVLGKGAEHLPNDEIREVVRRFDAWMRARGEEGPGHPELPEPNGAEPGSRPALPVPAELPMAPRSPRPDKPVSIVVYSKGDLEALRQTLLSIRRHTECDYHRVTVVQDSGNDDLTPRLLELGRGIENLHVISHEEPRGRLRSTIDAAQASREGDLCLLHEGVVVTADWLEAMIACAEKVGNAGAISPLTPSTSYSVFAMKPGDTLNTAARRVALLADPQYPTIAVPDLDVVLLRRPMLETVPPPAFTQDDPYRAFMARWIFAAYRKEFRALLADDTLVHVPRSLANDAASPPLIEQLTPAECALFEEIENGSDCPEIDVIDRYDSSELTLVESKIAVFLLDGEDGARAEPAILRLANDLVLRGIDVRVVLPARLALPLEEVEPLFEVLPDEPETLHKIPRHAHVIATNRRTARIAAAIAEGDETIRAFDIPLDLEARPHHADDPDPEATARSLSQGPAVLVSTEWMRKEARQITQGTDVAIRKIPFGVPREIFRPAAEPRPESDQRESFRILARIPDDPHFADVLFAACAKAADDDATIAFDFVGTIPDGTREVPLPVSPLPSLSAEDRAERLRRSDLHIDLSFRRGLSESGLEAFACGCPTILTNCGGAAEFARHAHNAWLVEPGSVEDLHESLLALRHDHAGRRRMRDQALDTVRNYGSDRIAGELEYLIASHHARRTASVREKMQDITCNIIVPIHNEIGYVRMCVESLVKHTQYPHRVYLVNDGSDSHTREFLRRFVEEHDRFHLIENDENVGFVESCNRGMAATTRGDILLLNSDVIVTPDWLRKIVRCAYSDDRIGIVSPMSTRSSHLWIRMNPGDTIFSTAARIDECSDANYPDVVTPEGWCFFIRRECYEHLGSFDPVFGKGYCEESDYAMRALANGWRTVCADDTFVFHKGRVTFKGERGPRYKTNRAIFDRRWKPLYKKAYKAFLADDPLSYVRERYAARAHPHHVRRAEALEFAGKTFREKLSRHKGVLTILDDRNLDRALDHYRTAAEEAIPADSGGRVPQKVVFVLSTLDRYGGVISVTQLVNDLILAGVEARIVVLNPKRIDESLLLLTEPIFFRGTEALVEHFPRDCSVVATLWITLYYVAKVMEKHPDLVPHYFIQDYEPDFYPENQTSIRDRVIETYRLPARRFAKTQWIIDQVGRHDAEVHKVPPGLDLDLFYPRDVPSGDRKILLVMMRPHTKRRGFETMVEVLRELLARRDDVEVHAFGTSNEDLADQQIGFPFVNHGPVDPACLAELYSRADVYADFSTFQGFGRTGLEAMACRTACLLTDSGGVSEYAQHEENCLLVRPDDHAGLVDAVCRLFEDRELRARLASAGFETARAFEKVYSSMKTWELLTNGQYVHPQKALPADVQAAGPGGSA